MQGYWLKLALKKQQFRANCWNCWVTAIKWSIIQYSKSSDSSTIRCNSFEKMNQKGIYLGPSTDELSKSHVLNCTERVWGQNCTCHNNRFTQVAFYRGDGVWLLLAFLPQTLDIDLREKGKSKGRAVKSTSVNPVSMDSLFNTKPALKIVVSDFVLQLTLWTLQLYICTTFQNIDLPLRQTTNSHKIKPPAYYWVGDRVYYSAWKRPLTLRGVIGL